MKKLLNKYIDGKKVMILGLGKEGLSTYRLIRKYFPDKTLTIADKDKSKQEFLGNDEHVRFISGPDYMNKLAQYDTIFKTPGITLKELDQGNLVNKITSQTDIFLQAFHDQITGITGTKGKSTTASLLYHILKQETENAILVGNIGIPPLSTLDEVNEHTQIVMELSAHQLEFIQRGPKIAILLNLFQEHLDHYTSFTAYKRAKLNIVLTQSTNNLFIYNSDDANIRNCINEPEIQSQKMIYSGFEKVLKGCYNEGKDIVYNTLPDVSRFSLSQNPRLTINHNRLNTMAAIIAAKHLGIKNHSIQKGLDTFEGLEHRMEYVGEVNGVHYYNDSIATIPEATMEAVKSIRNIETLILGGYDRGIDYQGLICFLKKQKQLKTVILTGDAGKRIMNYLSDNVQFHFFHSNDYREIVCKAKQLTGRGKSCLLSPAAASYDQFKNFEERGRLFKAFVFSG